MRTIPTLMLALVIMTTAACSNARTPAGHEGYVTKTPIFTAKRFYSAQVGPGSTGMGWMLNSTNVDFQWQTVNSDFEVMSSDNLLLTFRAHVVIRPKPGTVKEVVENYGGDQWFNRFLNQPFRNAVYDSVSGYKALEAKANRDEIAATVLTKFTTYLAETPFEVNTITVGTVTLPQAVAKAQETKIAKETELAQRDFEIAIARKDAEAAIIEAEGIAKAQALIDKSLTPLYIQYKAIEAQRKMADSPNHTTVYIPVGEGGVPIIRTVQ